MPPTTERTRKRPTRRQIRYAVVGLGYIAQGAVLPAFKHAQRNSELVALVSDDPVKLRKLSRQHKVPLTFSYEQYEELLRSREIDAVYIALPNDMHRDYTVRAAKAGIHVLCEKPMALNEEDCQAMIRATEENKVKLMVAYRLHYEAANMRAVEIVQRKKLGDVRIFNSVFTMNVKDKDNIRLKRERGGGTLYDIGIYCINAARYIFRAEPYEVTAFSAKSDDPRFQEVDEMTSAVLRFPDSRLANFTCSFGASDVSSYQIVGTKGDLLVSPAYEYSEPLRHRLTINGRTQEKQFPKRDQFAPELLHFSDCIIYNRNPEPSGLEGLADVRIIRALYRSAQTGQPVRLGEFDIRKIRPSMQQEMHLPPVSEQDYIHAQPPSGS